MIKIQYIKIKDIFIFKEIDITFDELGNIVLVTGVNEDEFGLNSNGSGKSSFFNSIYFCLFGKVIDKRETDEVLRIGAEKGLIEIGFNTGHIVTRKINKRGNKQLKLKGWDNLSDNDLTAKKLQETVDLFLGCDYKTFLHSNYMSSDFSKAFIGKDTTPAERMKVFENFIETETLDICEELCKKKRRELEDKTNELSGSISAFNETLEAKNIIDTQSIKETLSNLKNDKEKIEKRIEQLKEDKRKTDEYEEKLRFYNNYLKKKGEVGKKQKELEEEKKVELIQDESDKLPEIEEKIKEYNNLIDQYSGNITLVCPECNTELIYENNTLKKKESESIDIESIKIKQKKLRDERFEIKENKATNDSIIKKREQLEFEVRTLKESISEEVIEPKKVEFDEMLLKEKRLDLTEVKNELDNLTSTLAQAESNNRLIKETKEKLKKYKEKLKEVSMELEKVIFWREGFKWIKSQRIAKIVPEFEFEANNILSNNFGFNYKVQFDTSKELKKGTIKPELNVFVIDSDGNKRSFESCSFGERSRIAIAVTLARKIIFGANNTIDLLLIDELLDDIDDEGKARLIEIMKFIESQKFIISHSEIYNNSFEDKLLIKKENGVSTIEVIK